MNAAVETSDARPAAPSDWAFSAVVAWVALLPRLYVAIAWSREPVWDGHYYHFGAERVAAGLGYSEDVLVRGISVWKPWCHYPVGYSALLGAVYRVFGSGLLVAPIVNAVLGALLVLVVHRLGLEWLGETRARLAAGLCALHPGLIAYSAVVMNEPLAALLLLLGGLCAVRFRDSWTSTVVSGAVLGLATLVRPTALLAAPFLAFTRPRSRGGALLRGLAATALAFVVTLPWTVRNCRVMDGCAFVSTNGGWNLAIGAISETGRFVTLRGSDGCPVVTGQVQQDRCWAKVGRDRILGDPLRWLALMPKKLGQTFDHESFAIEYLREAAPDVWPEDRRVAGRALTTTFHRALLLLAALGVVALVPWGRGARLRVAWATQTVLFIGVGALGALAAARDEHSFYLLALALPLIGALPLPGRPALGSTGGYLLGVCATTVLTHAVFFGDDRYHLVVTPVLCLLAAAALRAPAESQQLALPLQSRG